MKRMNKINRRRFIRGTLTGLAGAGLVGAEKVFAIRNPSAEGKTEIKEYRTLGRTGFKASDIGFGAGELAEPALLDAILSAGINYIDTAESYSRGGSERTIGQVINNHDRKKIFVSTKIGIRERDTKETIIERANKCLERLRTEYVDAFMMHMPSTKQALKNPHYHNAVQELKSQGKVRFTGLSNHGPQWNEVPETMEQVTLAAVEDGRFDVMLFVYNFLQHEQGENILKACKEKSVGATLMKTNPVLNYEEWKENIAQAEAEGRKVSEGMRQIFERVKAKAEAGEEFIKKYNLTDYDQIRDAAVKFVLSNPNVNSACLTIKNFADLEFYTNLSGARFTSVEKGVLAAYKNGMGRMYCRHACGECEGACSHQVPVNTIMRYNHYFHSQGRQNTAMLKYAALSANKADNCSNCAGFCEQACPYGVPIQGLLTLAHRTLVLS